ncbi:MAG: hypothetical protein FWE86_04355, partial [Oscillospiraceae bacterium]|nr:hypothetical protein [Oscillospiraceae bacterium]
MMKRIFCLAFAVMLTITVSLPVFAGGDLGVQNESGSDVSAADVTEPDVTETDVSETDEPIPEPIPEKPYGEMRGLTAAEYIADMKTGYNLGHSLDSWAQDAGYSDYYNCNAYSVQVLYEDYNPPQ